MDENLKLAEHYLDTIETSGRNLTKWESDFVESVSDQVGTKLFVSTKQLDILERIYAEKTA